MVPSIPGVPDLLWLGEPGRATLVDGVLTMTAPARSDWFNDPSGNTRLSSAPALVFPSDGDCQLSARISVDFKARFDAGVLFVHQTDDDYAKFCFEYSPYDEPMVVSVVTKGASDDSNGPVIDGSSVLLRVSRVDGVFAFHQSIDGRVWRLTRLFSLRDPAAPAVMGFLAQSPTGQGCTAQFSEIGFAMATLADPRDGA